MTWVLYHAGQGWLARGSVLGLCQFAEEMRVTTTLAEAHRFQPDQLTNARDMAAKLNAREGHPYWRAVRWDAACEIAK